MSELLKSIKRTPYQSLASFLILFLTLFLSLFFFIMTSFFNGILTYVETLPEVTVYFDKGIEESHIFKIRDTLIASGKVSQVKYTSQEDALKIYREENKGGDPLLLEMVSADILPASLGVYAKRPEFFSEIAQYVKKQPGVDEIDEKKVILDKLLDVTRTLRQISLFVFFFLIIIAFVVLMTTTAFKIALKKEEIELLRLLGASNFYIKKPFLAEGVFFGFVAGSLSFVLYFAVFLYAQPFLKSYFSDISQLPFYNLGDYGLYVWPPSASFLGLSYGITILFGMMIGFFGVLLSTSKYIK